ncbi:hypothetical protein COL26b_012680 [Colletotrichum chrysophilum]|uniref:uncharacterized protein n=1 Tax=Colletotrichum chrysophilum TaxID=1836956 RepID=UPI00230082B7|nr:uncharacterized protein COL26b_012680 [Colletotrichum chrysophilum]KAJ0364047.1 hypothetical protein COL26b_012680 [Colletotrichum chrysophilum]
MWLINTRTLKLEEFFDAAIPDYAILSHTWGSDEVSFQEFKSLDATSGDPADLIIKDRAGYPKIIKACGKALEYRLRYVWVDTCCIDKTSSAELSESINSMFKWHRSDVPGILDIGAKHPPEIIDRGQYCRENELGSSADDYPS